MLVCAGGFAEQSKGEGQAGTDGKGDVGEAGQGILLCCCPAS